jgi:NADH:ubiquinone oxidoreductase subunit 5 (subunit L)/multisubunit Na+/H+ antiporter MnhA subunit
MGYFGIGLIWLLLAIVLSKKFKLNIFWEYDPWGGWSRNSAEISIFIGWIVIVPVLAIIGLFYLFHRICTLFIGKRPFDDENEVRLHLLEAGYEESEAADIAKEIEEITGYR